MRIVIGTTSDRKIATARKVFAEYWPEEEVLVTGYKAHSGVPETPWDEETVIGARNRAQQARDASPEAMFAMGVESGLVKRYEVVYEEAWAVILTTEGKGYSGYSSGLPVPKYVLQEMERRKQSHSDVMTILEKQHSQLPNDTWGSYSGGTIARSVSIEEAIRNTVIQIIAPAHSFYRTEKI